MTAVMIQPHQDEMQNTNASLSLSFRPTALLLRGNGAPLLALLHSNRVMLTAPHPFVNAARSAAALL